MIKKYYKNIVKKHLGKVLQDSLFLIKYQNFLSKLIKKTKIAKINQENNQIAIENWPLGQKILTEIKKNNLSTIRIAEMIKIKESDLLKIIEGNFNNLDLFYLISKIKSLAVILSIDNFFINQEIAKIRETFDKYNLSNYKMLNNEDNGDLLPSSYCINLSSVIFSILFIIFLLFYNFNSNDYGIEITKEIVKNLSR